MLQKRPLTLAVRATLGLGTMVMAFPLLVRPIRLSIEASFAFTVRASATLRAQAPAARTAIVAAIKQGIEAYRRGESCEVPMPAVVASATKP